MKTWTAWLGSVFASGVLVLAAAAGWRASAPRLPDDAGWSDGRLARAFESHYDRVFPARALGISVWGAIDYVLFREGRPGVVVGEGGWLYTVEEFAAPPGGDDRVERHLDEVARTAGALAARGIALVVALVPAKARVYAEALDGRQPATPHPGLYRRALGVLRARGVAAPDLLGALRDCRRARPGEPVFLRTDTHWTPAGARCGARAVGAAAAAAGLDTATPAAYRTTRDAPAPHRGDLMKFLPLEPHFAALMPAPDALAREHTSPVAAGDLLGAQPEPAVALVGTSYSADPRWNFTGALQQVLAEDVVSHAAAAHGPFVPMREYLAASGRARSPRLVIWEIPERYLPRPDAPPAGALHHDSGGPSP